MSPPKEEGRAFKTLAVEFKSGGFNFRQRLRESDVAIYEKRLPGSEHRSFETIIIKNQPAFKIGSRTIGARETYPASERWGQFGFSYPIEAKAFEKFRALAARHQ